MDTIQTTLLLYTYIYIYHSSLLKQTVVPNMSILTSQNASITLWFNGHWTCMTQLTCTFFINARSTTPCSPTTYMHHPHQCPLSPPFACSPHLAQLQFNWHSIPQRERERHQHPAEPVRSPTMAGGLFSIDKQFFERLGTYDSGFDIWGGENLELSFKVSDRYLSILIY